MGKDEESEESEPNIRGSFLFKHPVNVERKKTMSCYLCGQETETYVEDCGERGPDGECYFKKKVPLCEGCFRELYPSQENIQKLSFWLHVFPSIERVRRT
jgi:hypothetical protein